jgi:hypothetical protein
VGIGQHSVVRGQSGRGARVVSGRARLQFLACPEASEARRRVPQEATNTGASAPEVADPRGARIQPTSAGSAYERETARARPIRELVSRAYYSIGAWQQNTPAVRLMRAIESSSE